MGGNNMVQWSKMAILMILAAMLLALSGPAAAQEKAKEGEPPYSKPYPLGQVTIKITQVAAGVGVQWGKGTLTYKGKSYTFKVRGIQLVGVGISSGTATGDVYNLFSIGEFPGHYAAVGAGATLFKGKEGDAYKNSKGVHILLKSKEKGVNFNIGPEGFTVRLEEAL